MRRLIEGFDYGRYDLKVLFFQEPQEDYWGLDWAKYPCERAFFRPGGHHDRASHSTTAYVRGRILAQWWRRFAPAELRFSVGLLRDMGHLRCFFRQHPGDLIHLFDGGCEPSPALSAWMTRYPCMVSSYCCLPAEDSWATGPVNRSIEMASFMSLNAAIVKTAAAGRSWARRLHVAPSRFTVIPNGLDMADYEEDVDVQALRRQLRIPDGSMVVGISARLAEMKGHKYLIDAAAIVRAEVPNCVFLIVGDGPLRNRLEQQVSRLGLQGTVRFLGYREDVVRLTWLYDVGVLPSISIETFGWAAAEAMACRKPVVGSALAPLAEVIGDGITGLLVPVGDSAALAHALVALLANSALRTQLGEAGRRKVETEFTRRRMLDETAALYDELLSRKRSSRHRIPRTVQTWRKDRATPVSSPRNDSSGLSRWEETRVSERPLVSVVIPAYNSEAYVTDAIESALAQTYRPIEMIVADDGSVDRTAELVKSYGPRVVYLRQENRGPSAARNLALRSATGEYVAFLDSDDVWHPQKLEVQVRFMEQHRRVAICDAGLAGFRDRKELSWGALDGEVRSREIAKDAMIVKNRFCTSTVMVRVDALRAVGEFDESILRGEDWDMWRRLTHVSAGAHLDAVLAGYRERPESLSSNAGGMLAGNRKVLRKAFADNPGLPWRSKFKALSYLHLDAALEYAKDSYCSASIELVKAVAIWPFPMGRAHVEPLTRAKLAAGLVLRLAGLWQPDRRAT